MGHPFTFSYAGFVLDGTDQFGCRWTTEDEDGWWASAPIRSSSGDDRAGQDGAFPSLPQRGARIVTLRGKVRTDGDLASLERGLRQLSAVPVTGEFFGYSEPLDMTLSGSAQLFTEPTPKIIHTGLATWMLSVKLPDPLLYSDPVSMSTTLAGVAGTGRTWPRVWPRDWGVPAGTTAGAVTVPNAGTATYWPTLRIDGPVINPVITVNETGDWVRINRTVLAGQWLDIDAANRRVTLNGSVSLAGAVTYSGRWLGVLPGGVSMSWAADTADAAARFTINGFEGAYL